jgi:hypothetical protein
MTITGYGPADISAVASSAGITLSICIRKLSVSVASNVTRQRQPPPYSPSSSMVAPVPRLPDTTSAPASDATSHPTWPPASRLHRPARSPTARPAGRRLGVPTSRQRRRDARRQRSSLSLGPETRRVGRWASTETRFRQSRYLRNWGGASVNNRERRARPRVRRHWHWPIVSPSTCFSRRGGLRPVDISSMRRPARYRACKEER